MIKHVTGCILLGSLWIGATSFADEPVFTLTEDVIYGRKHGTALTMDVFRPKKDANGAAVVVVVSGGFVSSHDAIKPLSAFFVLPLVNRGYTVFAVVHGSQPAFTVPEIIEDIHRSIRFIRYHAKDYGIDPNRIGICGASAGGHLSLMMGLAGEKGKPNAKDPIDRESSRVQAVACFFPPTDMLNFGKPGVELIRADQHLNEYRPGFDYRELDKETNMWVKITDPVRLREITKAISPITHVSAEDPPILIMHGDADPLVPIQQSEVIIAKLKAANVPSKLVVKKGAKHGWATMPLDMSTFADWFDTYLKPAKKPEK